MNKAGKYVVAVLAAAVCATATGTAMATVLGYYEFETQQGSPVSDGMALLNRTAGAVDNSGTGGPSGTPVNDNTPATYVAYGANPVPANIDPMGVTGNYYLSNPDPNLRVGTLFGSNAGNLANATTMEGFMNLQEDFSSETPDVVRRRLMCQKKSDTTWNSLRVVVGVGYSSALQAPTLAITYWDTGGGAHHVIGSTPVGMDGWHHFAITIERDEINLVDNIRFYLDGMEDGSVLGLADLAPAMGKELHLFDVNANVAFRGLVDQMRISDEALTPGQFLNAPEPASFGLLAIGGMLLVRRRRGR